MPERKCLDYEKQHTCYQLEKLNVTDCNAWDSYKINYNVLTHTHTSTKRKKNVFIYFLIDNEIEMD